MPPGLRSRFAGSRAIPAAAAAARFLFVCAFVLTDLCAQPSIRRPQTLSPLSEEGARERIEHFRSQRLAGDYCFKFELEHIPARGGEVLSWKGTMWGTWNRRGPVARIAIELEEGLLELIAQNGPEPEAWVRRAGDGSFEPLEGEAYFSPLVEGLNYSAFDIQMPFVYWDCEYLEPSLTLNRHQFEMKPPEDSTARKNGVASVRIALDDEFNALRRVDVIGGDGETLTTFSVVSFKQVQSQWIVKVVDLTDRVTRDRTRFKVEEALVGIRIPVTAFDPALGEAAPAYPDRLFDAL